MQSKVLRLKESLLFPNFWNGHENLYHQVREGLVVWKTGSHTRQSINAFKAVDEEEELPARGTCVEDVHFKHSQNSHPQ